MLTDANDPSSGIEVWPGILRLAPCLIELPGSAVVFPEVVLASHSSPVRNCSVATTQAISLVDMQEKTAELYLLLF